MANGMTDRSRLYDLRVGDWIMVGTTPHEEPQNFGIVVNVGNDSVDAFVFPKYGGAAFRYSGLRHYNDDRVDPNNQFTWGNGLFRELACTNRAVEAIVEKVDELDKRIESLEKAIEEIKRRLDGIGRREK